MSDESLSPKPPKTVKRTTKPKIDPMSERVEKLENALCKIATLSGHANYLAEFGLERWVPSKEDMRKFK